MANRSKVANHLHRYRKVDLGRNGNSFLVYKCTKPACSHYVRMELAEGKLCECNRCGDPMIITKGVLRHSGNKPMAKPHCPKCIKRKDSGTVAAIAEYLNQS
jgi:hypothetical protein